VPFFENCDYYIGNEGGARHLAQGVGIPSFAVFNPSAELKEWLPFPSDKNMGISPIDMLEKKGISREEYDKLPFEEKFSLIDVETLIEMSDKLIEKNKRK
ncbi:MAG: lipopolysaccharide heptosyltransferase family protein, partial [Fusobacterium periodonticum]|nr:lipopolysaccharide heptosyltransferase family protein [Fusobacterium periodonticum]